MKVPEVSVLMSVFNGAKYLQESIESILNQTYKNYEFIIIDDASTDNTSKIIENYAQSDQRITILRNESNIGLTRSLNRGLKIANGRYIARQDADDKSMLYRFERQVGWLNKKPSTFILGSAWRVIGESEKNGRIVRQPAHDTDIRWQMLFHNAFCHTSVMFRREDNLNNTDRLNIFYDDSIEYSQDYELWGRLLEKGSGENIKDPLVESRIHDKSITEIKYNEQQYCASQISKKQMLKYIDVTELTIEEINKIRGWFYNFPDQLFKDDYFYAKIYLDLLNNMKKRDYINRKNIIKLIKIWRKNIYKAISVSKLLSAKDAGIIKGFSDYIYYLQAKVLF